MNENLWQKVTRLGHVIYRIYRVYLYIVLQIIGLDLTQFTI